MRSKGLPSYAPRSSPDYPQRWLCPSGLEALESSEFRLFPRQKQIALIFTAIRTSVDTETLFLLFHWQASGAATTVLTVPPVVRSATPLWNTVTVVPGKLRI